MMARTVFQALVEKPPTRTRGIRGRIATARFRHRRRKLEAHLFVIGNKHLWYVVKHQNDQMGVWK